MPRVLVREWGKGVSRISPAASQVFSVSSYMTLEVLGIYRFLHRIEMKEAIPGG